MHKHFVINLKYPNKIVIKFEKWLRWNWKLKQLWSSDICRNQLKLIQEQISKSPKTLKSSLCTWSWPWSISSKDKLTKTKQLFKLTKVTVCNVTVSYFETSYWTICCAACWSLLIKKIWKLILFHFKRQLFRRSIKSLSFSSSIPIKK